MGILQSVLDFIRGRRESVPGKQAENEAIAVRLRGAGYKLASEYRVGMIRQHYDAKRELHSTPFATYAFDHYRAFYPN